ncbi:CRISPR system precrRNA processing endoribonuclease RAMP protein Cas6 [Yunchengibacter salinarum]|uniref:CRISPR system precrRNA processing endoribonuclease RAMP protein Cas6 n=1 Tax=Yunchengibacter salinarum TaxID=3133399 RepID=UPI0035B66D14
MRDFAFLHTPADAVSPAVLGDLWRHATLTVETARPDALETGPWLPGAFRGALGRQVHAAADGGAPGAALLRAALFDTLGQYHGNQPIPKPALVQVDDDGTRVRFRLRLFGEAMVFTDFLADLAMRALAGGLPLRENGRQRVAYEVLDAYSDPITHVRPVSAPLSSAVLVFRTPLCVTRTGAMAGSLDRLLLNMLNRLAGLARWQDMALDTAAAVAALKAAPPIVRAERMTPISWTRYSLRQGDQPIVQKGMIGTLALEGLPDVARIILPLAETCHVGGQTVFGFGRFELGGFIGRERAPGGA